uniref:Uncharacterized protein n=2 Tax=Manihot esculenta TaxID=3983 RepID=A0A2C9VVW1_MANES
MAREVGDKASKVHFWTKFQNAKVVFEKTNEIYEVTCMNCTYFSFEDKVGLQEVGNDSNIARSLEARKLGLNQIKGHEREKKKGKDSKNIQLEEVQIWASNKIQKEERSCMGKWDVQSLVPSSSEIYGPEKSGGDDRVPRHVNFSFKNPVRCRIIWITLRLQRPGSNSVNFERDFNLLSLEENPFAQVNRRASFGGSVENDLCLHARRILVVGTPVKKEMGLTSQGSDQMNFNSLLERTPQLNRFKIPIEAERQMDNDLALEQYLPPASPILAGFRFEAFTAIKPRVTHSPSSDVDTWDTSVTFLEDRHISPAVLYLQVSALQEPHSMVIIGEYRLPEAKSGTSMYFDFPRQIQTRRVSFKLLGDVTAFTDDPAEQDDNSLRAVPLAAGLSLSNRIKLYYYADPYELGKWASLSAI